jgi:hypothetical protein
MGCFDGALGYFSLQLSLCRIDKNLLLRNMKIRKGIWHVKQSLSAERLLR